MRSSVAFFSCLIFSTSSPPKSQIGIQRNTNLTCRDHSNLSEERCQYFNIIFCKIINSKFDKFIPDFHQREVYDCKNIQPHRAVSFGLTLQKDWKRQAEFNKRCFSLKLVGWKLQPLLTSFCLAATSPNRWTNHPFTSCQTRSLFFYFTYKTIDLVISVNYT